MKKQLLQLTFLSSALLLMSSALQAQTVIYFENFDASTTALPSGWNSTTSGWEVSTSNTSTVFAGGSGGSNVKIDNNNVATGTYSLTTKSISTTGYSNITVSWIARLTTNFPPSTISPNVYYSTNGGSSWTPVSYTEASSASTWAMNTNVAMGAGAANQSSVMFQLVANVTHASNGAYRIDDFTVEGIASTGIEEQVSAGIQFYAYHKTLFVRADQQKNMRLKVYAYDGREVYNEILSQASSDINLEAFSSGIYFISIETEEHKLYSKKVILD